MPLLRISQSEFGWQQPTVDLYRQLWEVCASTEEMLAAQWVFSAFITLSIGSGEWVAASRDTLVEEMKRESVASKKGFSALRTRLLVWWDDSEVWRMLYCGEMLLADLLAIGRQRAVRQDRKGYIERIIFIIPSVNGLRYFGLAMGRFS